MNFQDIFCEYYKDIHGISFYFDAKEGKNLNLLVKKIQYYWKVDRKRELNEIETFKGLKYFLDNIEDEFTLQQLTPSMINSRFNIINQQIYSKRKQDKVLRLSYSIYKNTKW